MATYTSNYGWTKPSGSDNVDISVLNNNLDNQDSTIHDAFLNMAPPFSESSTYAVDDIVLYGTGLYKCHTAVVTPGSWTGSTNWQVHKLSEGGVTKYADLPDKPSINGNELSGNKTGAQLGLQNALTFDNVPTANSTNPVKSGGVYSADEAIRKWTTAEAKSVSGNPITLTDGSARNAEGLVVTLEPNQSGSGTPSPDNVRPITGYTECVVTVKDEDETTQDTATIAFGQTLYGGSVDLKTGKAMVTHVSVSITGDNVSGIAAQSAVDTEGGKRISTNILNAKYCGSSTELSDIISDRLSVLSADDIYNEATPNCISVNNVGGIVLRYAGAATVEAAEAALNANPVQACYPLATPIELTLTPAELELLKGYNYITSNGTTIALAYLPDSLLAEAEAYVDAKIPPAPSSDGTYVLTCTVTSGTPAYSWESAT